MNFNNLSRILRASDKLRKQLSVCVTVFVISSFSKQLVNHTQLYFYISEDMNIFGGIFFPHSLKGQNILSHQRKETLFFAKVLKNEG